MRKIIPIHGFTVGELMVWIALISILGVWISQINFNRLSNQQNSEIELVKITSIIQWVRNNALIGKAVWENLDSPDNWFVTIDTTGSWTISSGWNIGAGSGVYASWNQRAPYSIQNLRCQRLDGVNDTWSNPVITVTYVWSQASISGCNDSSYKKVVFDLFTNDVSKEVSINAVTWIVKTN